MKTTVISTVVSIDTSAILYTTTNVVTVTETLAHKNTLTKAIFGTETAAAATTNILFSTETSAAFTTTNVIFSTETAQGAATTTAAASFSILLFPNTTTALAQQGNATAPAAVFTGGATPGVVGQKSSFFGFGLLGLVMLFL
jgi:hypothetical protein